VKDLFKFPVPFCCDTSPAEDHGSSVLLDEGSKSPNGSEDIGGINGGFALGGAAGAALVGLWGLVERTNGSKEDKSKMFSEWELLAGEGWSGISGAWRGAAGVKTGPKASSNNEALIDDGGRGGLVLVGIKGLPIVGGRGGVAFWICGEAFGGTGALLLGTVFLGLIFGG